VVAKQVRERAKELLASGRMADDWTAMNGVVGHPLVVEHPQGQQHSWFVPVLARKKLIGFLELDLDLTPLRFSSFQRRSGVLEGSPEAEAWLDQEAVKKKAAKLAGAGEVVGEPYLSYDSVPSRLAWAVPIRSRSGKKERLVYVAGDAVYEAGDRGGLF
jgi:hypothetical protein